MNDVKTICIIVLAISTVVFLVLWLGTIGAKRELLKTISKLETTNKKLTEDYNTLSSTNRELEQTISEIEKQRSEAYRGFEQTISELQGNRKEAVTEIDGIIRTVDSLEKAIIKFLDMGY